MTKLEQAASPETKNVDLLGALATLEEPWSPRIVGRYEGNKIVRDHRAGGERSACSTCSSSSSSPNSPRAPELAGVQHDVDAVASRTGERLLREETCEDVDERLDRAREAAPRRRDRPAR
jgi:hypothetical protein